MPSQYINQKSSSTNYKHILYFFAHISSYFFLLLISLVVPLMDELQNADYVSQFQKWKVCMFIGCWSLVYSYSLIHNKLRYFIPHDTFLILPKSKTEAILFTIKRMHCWKVTLIYHALFVLPIFLYPIPLKDNLPYLGIYFGVLILYSTAAATMWHTKYNIRRINDYCGLCQYPFLIFILGNGLQSRIDLKYFIEIEIAISIFVALFFFIRRYKYCK